MNTPVDAGVLQRILGVVAMWHQRAQDRHALAQLGEHERRDLGIALNTIEVELRKPFWRA